MKNFKINLFLFSFGFLLINLFFYFLFFKPALFDRYIYNERINNYNIFLVSDSHGAYIEDVPSEKGIFNFSNTGENYLDMLLKIKHLSSILTEKDTILLSIDNHSLSSYREGYGHIEENIIFVSDFNGIESSAIKFSYYLKRYTKYLPLLAPIHNKSLLRFLKYQVFHTRNDNTYSKLSNEEKENYIVKRYEQQFADKNPSLQQKIYLEEIINVCKNKRITLIGIRFPITKEYYELIDEKDFGIKEFWSSKNLPLIDLHDIFFDRDECFTDPDHLNKYGGELFCDQIRNILTKKEFH